MMVVIALEAFTDSDQWRFLDRIVDKVADGWHHWLIEDPTAIEKSGWLEGRGWLREFFQKAALVAGYPVSFDFPRRQIRVSPPNENSEDLSPQQAAEYICTPLAILMENRFTDGIFLDAVLYVLAPREMNVQRRTAPESIKYDSPGGNGELPKLIRDYAARASAKGIPARAVVFTDSDASVPGEVQLAPHLVREACQKTGLPCWILGKRAIENYIPDEVLDAWLPHPDNEKRRIVDALKRLNPEQRDHYPMKKGLKFEKETPAVQTLFAGIAASDLDGLAKGFGKNVIETLRDYRDVLSAEALRLRDGQGELEQLVKMISDEL